jgi:hypothetical protein
MTCHDVGVHCQGVVLAFHHEAWKERGSIGNAFYSFHTLNKFPLFLRWKADLRLGTVHHNPDPDISVFLSDPEKKEKILSRARQLMTEAGFKIGMSDGGTVHMCENSTSTSIEIHHGAKI